MKNILFVCTGNTCRSPMAEALLKKKLSNVNVKSAGLFALKGGKANDLTVIVLQEKGISLSHQSQPFSLELSEWADLILTMTEKQKEKILLEFPQAKGKVYALKQYVSDLESDVDISDPFGGTIENYRQTLTEIEMLVDKLVKKLTD